MNKHFILKFKIDSGIKVCFFFIACLILSMVLLLPFSAFHYKNLTQTSVLYLETELTNIKSSFIPFLDKTFTQKNCASFIREFRQKVFNEKIVKESGIFNQEDHVFCSTTQGDVSFNLFKSIRKRLNDSPTNTTLSYTKTAITGEKSVLLIFSKPEVGGISSLIPPQYLIDMVKTKLSPYDIDFKLAVIDRGLTQKKENREITQYSYQSDKYPLSVTAYLGLSYYLNFLLNYLWFGCLVAGVSTSLLVFYKHKKLSQSSLGFSLSNALDKHQLYINYQPIVENTDPNLGYKVVGCESLLRWKDPQLGNVPPDVFIPLAERSGLINDLTYFVLKEALNLLKTHKHTFKTLYISVNISRKVICRKDFIEKVNDIFKNEKQLLTQIVFEITENTECSEAELVVIKENLKAFSELGVKIAIDDFGTGYSGLDFIRKFPFHILKIDKVFVKNITDESSYAIPLIESIIQISNSLKTKIIVEGVENIAQVSTLNNLGIECIQGFHFYKPVPKKALVDILRRQKAINNPNE
ncbi:sensory box (GGDEF/EAL domain) regulatory protein [Marinomonas sp. MED121]|uniref:EAL domain-containing protein n=1 Tax=Marinomonas sp. MED121 TaxID=314277 RepID=UPI0000690A10|nr:EAL domain-containing protein [Marinomonas sp. MED121]EAQ64035.1 sensory box (GGDEF/EAL domain) regulatory protein [Marinomonas sp. MED121]